MKPLTLHRLDSLLHVLLISFFVAVAAPRSRAAINVVSYWRLGESDPGATAGAAAASTTDIVGGMNLTFQGNARYASDVAATAANRIASLLSVNFTNSAYAITPIVSTATDNFGIECWAKPTALGGGQVIAYNGGTGGAAGSSGWGIILAADNTYQGLFGGITTIGTSPATANVWTHLALVCSSGVTTLYVNGVPSGSSSSGMYTPQGNFALGAPPQSPTGQFFTGLIDEVRVFTFAAGQFTTSDLLLNQFRAWNWTGPANDVWSNTNDWTRAADGVHGVPGSGDTVNSSSDHAAVFFDDVNSMSLDSLNVLSTSEPFYHLSLTVNSGGTGAKTLTFTGAGVRDLIPSNGRYTSIELSAGSADTVRGGSFIIFANSASASTADSLTPVQYNLQGAPGFFINGGQYHSYVPGEISFTGNSSAGNAVFTLNPGTTIHSVDGNYASLGGIVSFSGNASGGNASFYMGGFTQNGVRTVANLNISGLSSAGTTVGEISGSGQITLGSKSLTVGSRNTDSSFTGAITGAGGSIIKVGTGSLVLAGTNTYTGGTIVSNGSIVLNNSLALPSTAPLAINGGILDLRGFNGSVGALSGTGGTIQNRAAGLWTLSIGNGGNGGGTFAGTIVDHITIGGTVGLTVNGGVQTLTGANTYTGPTTVSAGTLIVNGSLGATLVTVAAGATLIVNGTIAGPVTVNGLLSGSGVLNGPLTNNAGGKVLITGGTFTADNSVVNNGTFVLRGGALLLSGSASFQNSGTFDIITAGSSSLPSNFVNQGTVLDGSALRLLSPVNTGTNVVLSINGYSDHTFQLQSSADLTPGTFANVGTAQSGITGSTLTFTDPSASGPQQFYRVFVNP
jgi:autotransporter-associated beta strand protein